jgi:hypothetical protein
MVEDEGKSMMHARVLNWHGRRLEIVGFLTHDDISHVTWVDHDAEGHPVRFLTAGNERSLDTAYIATDARCEWEDGRCVRVHHGELTVSGEYDEDGLRRIHGSEGQVVWDRSRDAWEPDPLPRDAAFATFGTAVAEATRRAVAQAGVRPAIIKVEAWFDQGIEPRAIPVTEAQILHAAPRVGTKAAIVASREGVVPLLGLMDEAGLRAWRSLQQRDLLEPDPPGLARTVRAALADAPWPVLLYAFDEGDPWTHVDLSVLAMVPAPTRPAVDRPPATRDELIVLLRAFALPEALAAHARWGVALLEGGSGVSRLGGRLEIPGEWPEADGRPLTHLATIDLAELPDVEGRDVLPADGTIVFCADLSEEGAFYEPTRCDDPRLRLLHLAPGTETRVAEPPAGDPDDEWAPPYVLQERRVRLVPVLTLPPTVAALDGADSHNWHLLSSALAEVTPGQLDPGHLMLGHPLVVQSDPRERGEVNLLHIGSDEALGFEYLDAADITFYAPAENLRAGRWGAVTAEPQSS